MPTIRDVAKLAGVAPITASRVINNSGYASEGVRRRVRQAAEQLGYTPNALARSLRSKQTHTLALVLSDITNPFWTTVARGVEDVASEAGFNVILCNTDESEAKQTGYLQALIQKQVDGVLLVPASSDSRSIEYLQNQRVPLVLLDRSLPRVKADVVRGDSEEGAYQLVNLLVSLGHREIATLGGPAGISSADERVAGYRRALLEAGLNVDESLIHRGEFTLAGGYEMMQALLAARPDRLPTAVFAGNNFIAVGALKAVREAGFSVPEDISMACFDDLPVYLIVEPFWTVAAQPAYELGQRAARRLIERLSEPAEEPREIVLPVSIIERKSTRAPST
ncbi:MAG: LacI family DNA-binding transcriptional regulator [Chloroflexota bacterium]